MKELNYILLLVSVIALTNMACSKKDISPSGELEVHLVVLNEDGEKSNAPRAGADFSIGFEIVNNSADTIFFSDNGGKMLHSRFYKHEDFLLVYKLDEQRLIPIGKPYDPSIELNFLDIGLPIYAITLPPKSRQYVFCYPWSNNSDNQPLSPGAYYSSFEDTMIINGIELVVDTSIDFTVNGP